MRTETDGPSFERAAAAVIARGRGRMVPDLDRITLLLELLGQPQRAYPTIHVTGTNGKGSVVRLTAALLSAAGLSAGTYTSPHLQTIRERMQVAGRRIGEQAFAELYEDVAPLAALVDERSADAVTYFELLTAMASWWFAELPVDVGVFEVGMGGTWDATNLVRGNVCVLQPIDVDHPELGGTPAEVAREKAGIVKDGSIVVCAAQDPAVLDVIRARCEDVGAELRPWGTHHELLDRRPAPGGQAVDVRIGDRVLRDLFVPVVGAHQADTTVVAFAAVSALLGPTFDDLSEDAWRQGLLGVSVPGRLEVVNRAPTVVLDGAHNPHGAAAAAAAVREQLAGEESTVTSVVLVVGVLGDKDITGVLAPWRDLAGHVVLTRAPSPRAATTAQLRAAAEEVWAGRPEVAIDEERDVGAALAVAEERAGPTGTVVVAGSLYVAGAARDRYLPVLDTDDEIVYEPQDVDDEVDERRFEEALDLMIERVDRERGDGVDEGELDELDALDLLDLRDEADGSG